MKRKKKIAIAAFSTAAAVAIVAGSAFAFFSATDKESTKAKAGGVQIAPETIVVGNASVFRNVDSEFILTYDYCGSSKLDIASSAGPWAKANIGYTPRWKYTTANQMLETNYFRTSDGEVSYCMDLGKHQPSQGAANEATAVSDAAQRILAYGYPTKTAADYQADFSGLTDIQLEWATQVALKISEGTGFLIDTNNNAVQDNSKAITLDQFTTDVNDNARFHPTYTSKKRVAEAENILKLVKMLVDKSKDSSTIVNRFELSVNDTAITKIEGGYNVGPYKVTSTYKDAVALSADKDKVVFQDKDGNAITSVTGNSEFYVFVPDGITEQVKIVAEIAGKQMPASYYYWTGKNNEQKMLVAKTIPAKAETSLTTTFDEKMDTWNPGDVTTFMWDVKNTCNKSIDTRNTLYMYWEDSEMAESPIYLYQEATSNSDIAQDIANNAPTKNIDIGGITTFEINGEQKQGYKFVVQGDTLDGVGDSAEEYDAIEVDYGSTYDDSSTTSDKVAFKVALSPWASFKSMQKNFKIVVVTEAKQYHNTKDTNDNGWEVVGTTEVKF